MIPPAPSAIHDSASVSSQIPASPAECRKALSSTPGGSHAKTCSPAEAAEERIAARAVDRTHPAQVAIELARTHEVGERELLERRRSQVVGHLGAGDPIDQRRGHEEPPKT